MKMRVGLFLCLCTLWVCSSVAFAETITLRADEWCPYNCIPKSRQPGVLVEIAQEVFEEAGHTIDYQLLPWNRAIKETREGKSLAIIGAVKEEAPDFIFPEQALAFSGTSFFTTNESSWTYTGPESLSQVQIGVIDDYFYGEELDAYINAHRQDKTTVIITFGENAFEKSVELLVKGRIDVMLADCNVMNYYLKQSGKSQLIHEVGRSEKQPLYIAFSPNDPNSREYARLLSEGTERLRRSGRLAQIFDKYGM